MGFFPYPQNFEKKKTSFSLLRISFEIYILSMSADESATIQSFAESLAMSAVSYTSCFVTQSLLYFPSQSLLQVAKVTLMLLLLIESSGHVYINLCNFSVSIELMK